MPNGKNEMFTVSSCPHCSISHKHEVGADTMKSLVKDGVEIVLLTCPITEKMFQATLRMSKTTTPLSLVVTKRSSDYHCYIAGKPSIWCCGQTPTEVIGKFVCAHPAELGIKIEMPT